MSVIERPLDYKVGAPTGPHFVLEPFRVFESHRVLLPLVVLNTPMHSIPLRQLWAASSVVVCADGGANRLYDYFGDRERDQYIPGFITGDLDSLREDVRAYYAAHGATIIPQYSQYSTDFMKAVKVVALYHGDGRSALYGAIGEENGLAELMAQHTTSCNFTLNVAGGIDGRFDQTFQLINQLYTMKDDHPDIRLFFFTASDIIFLLPKGTTWVKYGAKKVFHTDTVPKCGLLPFGRRAVLNTEGLQYDVEDWESFVGGPVSSSNGVVGVDGFVVETTEDIVMNIEVAPQAPGEQRE